MASSLLFAWSRLADNLSLAALIQQLNTRMQVLQQILSPPVPYFDMKYNGLKVDSATDDYTALNTLVNTTMQPAGGQLDVPGVVRIGSNITIPANVRLNFAEGASLAPDVGVVVTIRASIVQTVSKIFSGAGTVTFAGPKVRDLYGAWWGMVADDTADDTTALQAAATAVPTNGARLWLPPGTIRLSARVTFRGGTHVLGDVLGRTIGKQYSNVGGFYASATLGSRNLRFADFQLLDAFGAGRTVGHGIEIDGTTDAAVYTIERVIVQGFMDNVRITGSLTSSLSEVRSNTARNDGFSFYGLSTSTSLRSTYANGNLRHGYYCDGGQAYFNLKNTASDSNVGDAYHLGRTGGLYCTFFTADSPGAEGVLGHAIYCLDGYGHVINAPKISMGAGTLKDCIRFDGSQKCTVVGGEAFNATGYGVNVLTSATPTTPADIVLLNVNFSSNALGPVNDPNGVVSRWQGGKLTGNLQVTAQFGCNSKVPQAAYSVGAAATDTASTQALANNIRLALIANGIAV